MWDWSTAPAASTPPRRLAGADHPGRSAGATATEWSPTAAGSAFVRLPGPAVGLIAAGSVLAAGLGVAAILVPSAPGPPVRPAVGAPQVEDYPDLVTRELRRLAAEPRPVPRSALPPRHLDTALFPTSLVERTRIVSGGPAPDGIPALDSPDFAPARTIDWLADDEPVLVLQLRGTVRAYPVQVMVWHEIVNDRVGGVPVAVTYCPLCNSGIAFDRRVDRRVLDFGTSGALYQSALVMYDRQTESLWTHFDGRAVIGTLVGARLRALPVATVAWRDFLAAHPDAPVLTRDTGYERPYGRNLYVGYDQGDGPLTGFFTGEVDGRLPAMARVVGVNVEGQSVALPTQQLAQRGVIETRIGGRPVVVWHAPGLASSLHRPRIADGDDVGATGAFFADHPSGTLRFTRAAGRFVEQRSGSTFNVLGEAVDGPLAGERLRPVRHVDTFWFAWSTYRPSTRLIRR